MYSIYAKVGDATVCLFDDSVANSKLKVIDPVLTLEDNSAGSLTFKLAPNNVGYGEYEITEYVSSGEDSSSFEYTLTTSAPPDWLTDFASYYTFDGSTYTSVTGPGPTPTFVSGHYYKSTVVGGQVVYPVLSSPPDDWDTAFYNYYYYDSSTNDYKKIPYGPAWEANTYYSRTSTDTPTAISRTVNLVERMASIITVYRTDQNGIDQELWQGRVLSENNDFNNLREIYCEGELAFLNDTIQPQREFGMCTIRQFVEAILNTHNGKVDDSKKFFVGMVVVTNDTIEARRTDYGSTWEALSSLIEDCKLHVEIRKFEGVRYLDIFSDYPRVNSQKIRLGSNLLDFTRSWNMSQLATAVLPTGAVTESATSSSVGEPITPDSTTKNRLLYIDDDDSSHTVKIRKPGNNSYVVNVYTLQADTNYYLSSRLNNAYVAYVLYTSGGKQHSYKQSGRSGVKGFEDRVDEKFKTPPSSVDNTYTLKLCSWGDDIPPVLKAEIPATEDFDKYVTVVNAQSLTGFSLLVSMPNNWYTDYTSYYTATYTSVPSQGGSAPAFTPGDIYDYSEENGYVALVNKPDDWSENYANYFIKTSGYSPVTGAHAPEWKENTYYQFSVWHTTDSPYVVNQSAVTKYGWIEKHLEYKDIDDPDALCAAAKTYLESGQFDEMTIEISAVDLGCLGVDYESIRLLDKVRVISDPHGMDRLFPVTKLEIPLDRPEDQKFSLGYSSEGETISAASSDAISTISDKIAGIPSMSTILESAQTNAAQVINNSQAGYITFLKDSDGHPYEMVISQTLDYTESQNVWRFNSGGLGFSNQGYSPNQFVTAITMDGHIVGSFISAGTVAGDAIYGGTITSGGAGNQNGQIVVNDASGNPICVFDNTGGNINGTMRTSQAQAAAGGGTDTFFSKLSLGKLIAGKVVNGVDEEWGRLDGRITYHNKNGLSLEAKRVTSTDGGGTTHYDDVSSGVLSFCAGTIVVAQKYATVVSETYTAYDNNAIPVGQSLSIDTVYEYTAVPSQSSAPTFEAGKYYAKNGNTYTVQNTQPPNWGSTYTNYYTQSSSKKLSLKGRKFAFMNGFLIGVGSEETLSSVTLPQESN